VHFVGRVSESTRPPVDLYAGRSRGYRQTVLVDGGVGAVHTQLTVNELEPGGSIDWHMHSFEEGFYILDGEGYEIHDGVRYDWRAGDVSIVHNNCVHQHFNADPDEEAVTLVMKAKPLFLFMHMLFQRVVDYPPKVGDEKQMAYVPPADL